jgi:phosphatidylserine/phosphatidylglycerophosphate/cardiolipin synthase-like enzyme
MDGRIAYTGGMAVADKWVGSADTEEHWRDTMVRVTGPLAVTLQSAFVAPWAQTTGELLFGPDVFPPDVPEPSTPLPGLRPPPAPDPAPAAGPPGRAARDPPYRPGQRALEREPSLRLFFIQSFVSAPAEALHHDAVLRAGRGDPQGGGGPVRGPAPT